MKKYLLLLLTTITFGQTYQNPTYGTITTKTNTESATATKVNVQETNGLINWLQPVNIPIPLVPANYMVSTPTLGAHLSGIDAKLGTVSTTTAGITTRVWFTADQVTIAAGTFDLTNPLNKGAAASHQQTVANDDGEKKYFTTDLIGQPFASATTFPQGTYAGNLTASTTPTNANQKFTVELYKCNNAGTPIASGVSGAPVGSLGVTVVMILDSGEVTLANASITNVAVSTILGSTFSIAVGERIRYHVSAEKVGTAGGVINESVYYGTAYNSYLDVPVTFNLQSTYNNSVSPQITTTAGLGGLTIKRGSASDTDKVINIQNGAGITTYSVDGNGIPSNNSTTDQAYNSYFFNAYGDSMTAGTGATAGTAFPAILAKAQGMRFFNFGVGGENSTQIKTRFIANPDNQKYPFIIWAGRNNFASPATVLADIAAMVAYAGHNRYLILSVCNGGDEPSGSANYIAIQSLNASLLAAYGVRFVDVRAAVIAAYNPALPQDVIDHTNDVPPLSLRFDNVHFNDAGYVVVSQKISLSIQYLQPTSNKVLTVDDLSEILKNPPSIGSGGYSGALQNDGFFRRVFINKNDYSNTNGESLFVQGNGVVTGSMQTFGAGYFGGNLSVAGQLILSSATANNFFQINGFILSQNATEPLIRPHGNNIYFLATNSSTKVFGVFPSGNIAMQGGGTYTDAGYRLDVADNTRLRGVLTLGTTPTTSAGTYDILTRNTSTGVVEKVASSSFATTSSGTYTPTAGTSVNVSSNTPELARWTKIGNTVTVQGSVNINPTAAGGAYLNLSLPINRTNSLPINIGIGSYSVSATGAYGSAFVQSIATSEFRVFLSFLTTNSHVVNYQFTYLTTE